MVDSVVAKLGKYFFLAGRTPRAEAQFLWLRLETRAEALGYPEARTKARTGEGEMRGFFDCAIHDKAVNGFAQNDSQNGQRQEEQRQQQEEHDNAKRRLPSGMTIRKQRQLTTTADSVWLVIRLCRGFCLCRLFAG
jgi:hypothetical protein